MTHEAQSAEQIAERFEMPLSWAQQHIGEHVCLDGRRYRLSCLVSDPMCEHLARWRMDEGAHS